MRNAIERIAKVRSLRFLQARTDYPICVPQRQSLMTGLAHTNHRMDQSFEVSRYYEACRLGRKIPAVYGAGSVWAGPWERDLALQRQLAFGGWGTAGAVTVEPVAASSQGATGGVSNSFRTSQLARGDTADDLQAFTGGLAPWLKHAGATCALIGKYQNKYGMTWGSGVGTAASPAWVGSIDGGGATVGSSYVWDSDVNPDSVQGYIPPGWDVWHCLDGDPYAAVYTGSTGNAYEYRIIHYEGDNPASSDGQVADSAEDCFYAKPVTGITRSGTVATVQCNGHGMTDAGEEFAMETGVANLDGAVLTVASIIDADHFTYTVANTGATTATGTCYPRRWYSESQWTRLGREFILSRDEAEPWFLYYAPHNPHKGYDQFDSSGDPTRDAPTKEVERRYLGTVDPSAIALWNGVPGTWPPVTDPLTITSTFVQEWTRRQEMLASVDDTIGGLLDACEERGWQNVTLIFTSDNGYLQGEHVASETSPDAWDNGKGYIWEGCLRMPLWIRHPAWGRSGVCNLPVSAADLPLTVLDIFGEWPACAELATHHAHTNRDGLSLLRLLNAGISDPMRARAMLGAGRWRAGAVDALALIDADRNKLVRDKTDTTLTAGTHKLFSMVQNENGAPAGGVPGNPPLGTYYDYEQTDLSATQTALCTALNARLEALKVGRWNPSTQTNTYRTA